MKVTLINETEHPLEVVGNIAGVCYGNDKVKNPIALSGAMLRNGHLSPFGFVDMTFKIEGISRACMAQLTRYRMATPMVRSQRYCNEEDAGYYVPDSIQDNPEAFELYKSVNRATRTAYKTLQTLGIPNEDARMVLPNSTITEMYFKCDLREFMHIYKQRVVDGHAQKEIHDVVLDMLQLLDPEVQVLITENEEYLV